MREPYALVAISTLILPGRREAEQKPDGSTHRVGKTERPSWLVRQRANPSTRRSRRYDLVDQHTRMDSSQREKCSAFRLHFSSECMNTANHRPFRRFIGMASSVIDERGYWSTMTARSTGSACQISTALPFSDIARPDPRQVPLFRSGPSQLRTTILSARNYGLVTSRTGAAQESVALELTDVIAWPADEHPESVPDRRLLVR